VWIFVWILVPGATNFARAQSRIARPVQADVVAYGARPAAVSVEPGTGFPAAEPVPAGLELSMALPPAPLRARAGLPGDSLSTSSTPWVNVEDWELPEICGTTYVTPELSPLALLERDFGTYRFMDTMFGDTRLDRSPAYRRVRPIPLFHVIPPRDSHWGKGLKTLVRAKVMREVRRRLRRQWQEQFENNPSMDYRSYQGVRAQINGIGKAPAEYDDFDVDYSATAFKQDILAVDGRDHDGEEDISLFTWGALTVTDTGGTKFDLGSLTRSSADQETLNVGEERRKPLLESKHYRVTTGVRLNVDPFRAYKRQDVLATMRSVGASVNIDWLSGVLRRELVGTEVEFQVRPDGEWKGFVNFVLNSR